MEHITEKNFNEIVTNKDKMVVVDFWASWCGPCRMMAPNFEQVAEELKDDYIFAKCNIDDCENIARMQNIQSIPTIAIYKNGNEIARFLGFCTQDELKRRIKSQN